MVEYTKTSKEVYTEQIIIYNIINKNSLKIIKTSNC